MTEQGWYGFDLDATLAQYDGWKGTDKIGAPVPLMLKCLMDHLAKGDRCKIFTARVAAAVVNPSAESLEDTATARKTIQAWCKQHVGKELEITCIKDFACICIYDDRAKQVVPNNGVLVEDLVDPLARKLVLDAAA